MCLVINRALYAVNAEVSPDCGVSSKSGMLFATV
jgi:hypothetical protein